MSDKHTRESIIVIPADECPFCGPGMMSGGREYTQEGAGECYYRCSCGAGESGDSYPDDFHEDETGSAVTQWIIAEHDIDNLLPKWQGDALENLKEEGIGA